MNNLEIEIILTDYGMRAICAEDLHGFPRPRYFVVNTDHFGNEGNTGRSFIFRKREEPSMFLSTWKLPLSFREGINCQRTSIQIYT